MNFQQSFPTSTGNRSTGIGSIGSGMSQSSFGGQSAIGSSMGNAGMSQSGYGQFNPYAQQYHAANYQGNQPGHDQDLRGDSSRPAQMGGSAYLGRTGFTAGVNPDARQGVQSSFGMGQSSFGGGLGQSTYGNSMGQSSYGSSMGNAGMGRSSLGMGQSSFGTGIGQNSFGGQSSIGSSMGNAGMSQSGYGQFNPYAQQYHAANYQGDQPGHDQDLRGDSSRPAQMGGSAYLGRTGFTAGVNPDARQGMQSSYGMGQNSFGGGMGQSSMGLSSFGGQSSIGSSMGPSSFGGQSSIGSSMGPSSFGGQSSIGSSMGPSSFGGQSRAGSTMGNTGMGSSSFGMGQSSFGSGIGQSVIGSSMGNAGMSQSGYGQYNPYAQQYHSANYQGDQPGHDQDLRGDSSLPAQMGGSAYLGRTGFTAGVNPDARQGMQSSFGGFSGGSF